MKNGNLKALKQCPICSKSKNVRCRVSDDALWLLCYNSVQLSKGEVRAGKGYPNLLPGNYIFVKQNDTGCNVFCHESIYQEKKSDNSKRKRTRVYQPFPEVSQLFNNHLKSLEARGLSKTDIDRGRFRSLPDKYIDEYYTKGTGFDVPVWAGNTVGTVNYQTSWDCREPKYSWAIWGDEGKWNNTEMPLTYINQDGLENDCVIACEGTLKPYIAYCLSGRLMPFLGASGGNFAASTKYLNQLIRKFNIKHICYAPDCGWRQLKQDKPNQVFRTVNESLITFKSLGVQTTLLDWGQADLSKDEGLDVDEWFQEWGGDVWELFATADQIDF